MEYTLTGTPAKYWVKAKCLKPHDLHQEHKQVVCVAGKEKNDKIRIVKITDGTVIDHISAGHALEVLEILGITGKEGSVVTLAMNISSSKVGSKDIVKLEKRVLQQSELAKIALVAPDASINIIQDGEVVKKTRVELPDSITNVVACPNKRCVTNKEREPIHAKYQVVSKRPTVLKCHYCWTLIEEDDIIAQFTEH
ncbi:MAG: aspartate carbamoyltransferase regulatory subunit [Candidatus Thorarchaeota archaeon]|jgi:aspartate carbamoyltransferase regulatory subunit|nr:aspartate carbamoyltransferase regulatory subunit [Candidatus Thorarchaeota archaeon]